MEESAVQKNHSTTSEAISIGREMAAENIVLTHFSQRYPKLPSIKDDDCLHQVSIAHDLMRIRFSEIHTVPALYSSLQSLLDIEEFKKEDGMEGNGAE
jgi:ribonuclease Z